MRMFARRQIDQPQYLAGRAYQEIADVPAIGSIQSMDLTKARVDDGVPSDILTDASGRSRGSGRLRI